MNTGDSILLMLDGDLPSLVAAALAAEARLVAASPTQSRAVAEVSTSEGSTLAWCVGNELQIDAATDIASHHEIRVVARSMESANGGEGRAVEPSRALRLVAAATAAARLGCRRLIWPIQAAGTNPGWGQGGGASGGGGMRGHMGGGGVGAGVGGIEVERVANLIDVATLVGRLVSIETGQEVVVEVPFVDLTDQQLVELVLDMGLDRERCWWAPGRLSDPRTGAGGSVAEHLAAEAHHARQRWEDAFARSGWPMTPIVRVKKGRNARA